MDNEINTDNLKKEKPIKLHEDSRIYDFGLGKLVKLEKVVELIVRDSGNHRVKTADGKLHIISTGWIHIEITDNKKKDWTV